MLRSDGTRSCLTSWSIMFSLYLLLCRSSHASRLCFCLVLLTVKYTATATVRVESINCVGICEVTIATVWSDSNNELNFVYI